MSWCQQSSKLYLRQASCINFCILRAAATPEGVTGSKNAAAGDTDGDGTNDVVLTAAGAIGGASALSAANSLLLGDDIGNGTITLKITLDDNTVLNTAATTEKFEEYLTSILLIMVLVELVLMFGVQ